MLHLRQKSVSYNLLLLEKTHIYGWSYSWRMLYVKTLVSFWRYMSSLSRHSAGPSVAQLCMKLDNRWTCSRARNFPGKRLGLGEGNNFLYDLPLKGGFISSVLFCNISFSVLKRICSKLHAIMSPDRSTLPREVQTYSPTKRNASITCLAPLSNTVLSFQAYRGARL